MVDEKIVKKLEIDKQRKKRLKIILKRFLRTKSAVIGLFIVLIICFLAIFANVLATHDPYEIQNTARLAPSSREYYFGTDWLGRDTFSRVLLGSRIALIVGTITVTVSGIIGITIGSISAYFGSWVDNIFMRIMDAILSFPYILLSLMFVAFLGPGIQNAIIAITIIFIPIFARIARSAVLNEKGCDYVVAAKVIGQSSSRIIFIQILPNIIAPIMVQASTFFAAAVIVEAGLSFIGLGIQPPVPSWGIMLKESVKYMSIRSEIAIFPAFFIILFVLGFNLLGDGLRDILDPRKKGGKI